MTRALLMLLPCAALFAAACGGGGSKATPTPSPATTDTVTATASATATTPTATPETILGVAVTPLATGSDVAFPNDAAFIVESGCWGCDQPAAALQRIYRDPTGTLRTEDLYRIEGATIAASEVAGRYIMSVAAGAELDQDLLLSLCESPYCGGVGPIAEGAKTSILHSPDGGVTWTKETTLDGGAWVVLNRGLSTGKGFGLLRRTYRPAGGTDWVNAVVSYPGLDTFPMGLTGDAAVNTRFLLPASGPALVLAEDGVSLYRTEQPLSGDPWPDFRHLPAGSQILDLQFIDNGILLTWTDQKGALYSGITAWPEPPKPIAFKAIYRWPEGVGYTYLGRANGGLLATGEWVVAVTWPGLRAQIPAIFDFKTATIRPIAEFRERAANDRNLVKAVVHGPFARVTGAGAGDCLNVRESPTLSAHPIECYADGVLLVQLGQLAEADGHRWVYVRTPSNAAGWASASFLQTSGAAPSFNYHPAGTRTGNAGVDAVIAALEAGDTVAVEKLIAWQKVACETAVQGLGGPPECPAGVANGTPIEVIQGAACEGYWRLRPPVGSGVKLAISPEDRLYAVVKNDPATGWRSANTQIIFVNPARPEFGKAVMLMDGRITGDWSGCGTSPAEIAARGSGVIFAPPSP